MRIVTLHDQAKLEIGEAAHWHNLREPGVGHELWQCVEAVLDVLQSCDIIPATPFQDASPSAAFAESSSIVSRTASSSCSATTRSKCWPSPTANAAPAIGGIV